MHAGDLVSSCIMNDVRGAAFELGIAACTDTSLVTMV
jgi:hypothetical protein